MSDRPTQPAAPVRPAIECYHAGYTTPLPEALLEKTHHLHLEDSVGKPPAEVFTAALDWARRPVAGASGLLEHHRGRGDQAFDYLLDHAARRGAPIQPRIWAILLCHATPETLLTIAVAAYQNGRTSVAHELARRQPTTELYACWATIEALVTWRTPAMSTPLSGWSNC
ncbi:MAG TPA: hypothetical protein VE196_12165 [Pseudonocardiaceae bacterium]|nr:hypothetical protein [Pseudonocardiaceae bacterium]